MKLIKNAGADRVIDALKAALRPGATFDLATPTVSLFAFAELSASLSLVGRARLLLSRTALQAESLVGGISERPYRNRLTAFASARRFADWLKDKDARVAAKALPQSYIGVSNPPLSHVITGACPFVTDGLGLTPGEQYGLIQAAEAGDEAARLGQWFDDAWSNTPGGDGGKASLLAAVEDIGRHKPPALVYFLLLFHLFKDLGEELDEERIVKSATGVRDSVVWKKLFKFQRDGVRSNKFRPPREPAQQEEILRGSSFLRHFP